MLIKNRGGTKKRKGLVIPLKSVRDSGCVAGEDISGIREMFSESKEKSGEAGPDICYVLLFLQSAIG